MLDEFRINVQKKLFIGGVLMEMRILKKKQLNKSKTVTNSVAAYWMSCAPCSCPCPMTGGNAQATTSTSTSTIQSSHGLL